MDNPFETSIVDLG